MKKWLALLCTILISAFSVAYAQPAWQIDLAVQVNPSDQPGALSLISITPTSVAEIALPGAVANAVLTDAVLSPDRRWLVTTFYPFETDRAMPLAIYDLASGVCCTLIDIPSSTSDGGQFALGGFSPDGSQFAVSYVGADYSSFEAPFAGGILTIDPQNGVIRDFSFLGALLDYFETPPAWAALGEWGEDGFIRFAPNCYACEPVYNGEYWLWNPISDEIRPSSGEFFDLYFSDLLLGTGEILYTARDEAFPGEVSMGYFPTANVVRYLTDSGQLAFNTVNFTPVVYFNANDIAINGRARWIADGRAALIEQTTDERWFMFDRFGAASVHMVPLRSRFIAATPDGWVAFLPDSDLSPSGMGRIVHFTVDSALRVTERTLTTLPAHEAFHVVAQPRIGIGATTIPFISVAPPDPSTYAAIMAQNIPSCPDTLPSRLLIGGIGRVTPGAPNRLRDQPNTQGGIIGMIPGGAPFVVLSGPVCDGQIVWWEVNYNGQVGYTAEIANNAYLVEPDNPIAAG
jgi:hypothetical protein